MAYEKGKPEPGIKAKLLDDRVRGNNDFIQPAINNEHNFVDADANNQSGDHTQGSARCYSQDTAPATRIDGSSFLSTDLGSLWIDTDDNALYILTATVPTWTAVSTEIIELLLGSARTFLDTLGCIGDFAVNTDKFNVTAANGNLTSSGTLEATGLTTVADGSLTKTDAAPAAGTAEIANAKYVDDSVEASIKSLGSWASRTSGVTYNEGVDGFVLSYNTNSGTNLRGFTPDSTLRIQSDQTSQGRPNITMPVKAGDTWKVIGASDVWWVPLS